ncbi:hypothetical protein RRG08_048932 [Elysia crispata]|uniref:EGF-like domain-containing protein n=1 Tax=Elysia crispata TaxID=231223 RepID=A0AAE0YNE1_9GAST|nr:hypothetical protein RRG08_048932 [Elysia crispata]
MVFLAFLFCPLGNYGPNCRRACSDGCFGGFINCDQVTGVCLKSCNTGYSPPLCEKCEVNTYGADCSKKCSPHCGGPNKTCDRLNGSCLAGCSDGYSGDKCDFDEKKHHVVYSKVAILSTVVFFGVTLFLFLCSGVKFRDYKSDKSEGAGFIEYPTPLNYYVEVPLQPTKSYSL